jgi:hypothetical protein
MGDEGVEPNDWLHEGQSGNSPMCDVILIDWNIRFTGASRSVFLWIA